jgi:Tol biopolymer transport system component
MSDLTPITDAKSLPRWQIGLLVLTLLAFLAASYAFLQPNRTENSLPPILYLAEDDSGLLQLNLANAPNWQPNQLTSETAVILNYASSPTGSQIAYAVTLPDGSSQIKLLPLNNGTASPPETLLTCANAECSQPVWHPDGRRLLVERREPPNFSRPQLWWLDTQTGETILLFEKETAVGSNARFSPDGNWVSFAASPDEGLRLYNFGNGRSLTFASNVGTPAAWHPFNNQLLFQNSRTVVFHDESNSNHDDFAVAVSLYLATLGTSNEDSTSHLLSEDGVFNDGNAAWSPDGKWIAFGRRWASTNTGRQLWLMRADGSEVHALTNDISLHFGPPSWSPDGRYLLFQQFDSTTPDEPPTVWLLEIASGEFIEVNNNGLLPTFLVLAS